MLILVMVPPAVVGMHPLWEYYDGQAIRHLNNIAQFIENALRDMKDKLN